MKTFPIGGVHPSENKLSGAKPIEVLPLPDVVTIPLAQHIGAPAVAKVAKGDKVVTGQLIAEAGSFMSANIHAPVSGTVTAVDMVPNGQGLRQVMITIKREGDDWAEGIDRSETSGSARSPHRRSSPGSRTPASSAWAARRSLRT